MYRLPLVTLAFALWSTPIVAEPASTDTLCLYVGSYHAGYHWNDGIERGLERALGSACRLERFYMDTKRQRGEAHAREQARAAMVLIEQRRPALVIACDDNASRYLVAPYLKDVATPVVFCGINWSVEPYGYPYGNATGMIEVAPIGPVIREALGLRPNAERLAFLSADVPTQRKDQERIAQLAEQLDLELTTELVHDLASWLSAYDRLQQADILILGNPAGIDDWRAATVAEQVAKRTTTLTVSFGLAMSPYAAFTMATLPEEQGEWAGAVARQLLEGTAASEIPIVANHRWRLFANRDLAAGAGIELPDRITRNAQRVELPQR